MYSDTSPYKVSEYSHEEMKREENEEKAAKESWKWEENFFVFGFEFVFFRFAAGHTQNVKFRQ